MISILYPMWVVGFVDGEGCFRASMIQNTKLCFGLQIQNSNGICGGST